MCPHLTPKFLGYWNLKSSLGNWYKSDSWLFPAEFYLDGFKHFFSQQEMQSKQKKKHSNTKIRGWNWVTVRGVPGCVCQLVHFKTFLCSNNLNSVLVQLFIVCSVSFLQFLDFLYPPPLFIFPKLSVHHLLPRSHSPPCSDWQVWWCLPLLSLTFNSPDRTCKHTHTAHSKTANGFHLCRLSQ